MRTFFGDEREPWGQGLITTAYTHLVPYTMLNVAFKFRNYVVWSVGSFSWAWSSEKMPHPYLALYNEGVFWTPGVSMLPACFCLIQLDLQLPCSNCLLERKNNGGACVFAYLSVCLSVWDNLSLGGALTFHLCFLLCRLSPCGFLLPSRTACLSLCLWLSFSFSFLIFSSAQPWCSAWPGGKQKLNVRVTGL